MPVTSSSVPRVSWPPGTRSRPLKALKGIRILSLALNLPGPAALMRCRAMGAVCRKLEPLPPASHASSDPMSHYCWPAYTALHTGIRVLTADLKTTAGQRALHRQLRQSDVLLTSFRPAALKKLSLDWPRLHAAYPALNHIAVVGAPGVRANEPGHDLTYMAEQGLVPGLDLPPTLYADMGGSLLVVEAILHTVLAQQRDGGSDGRFQQVALADAVAYLALPRQWGLTVPGKAAVVGGGHAGYGVYRCRDGRVAVAALEPHFALALCRVAGLASGDLFAPADASTLLRTSSAHRVIAAFFATQTQHQLNHLAKQFDLPLHTLT